MSKSVLIAGQNHSLTDIRRDADTIAGCIDGDAFAFRVIHRDGGWLVLADETGQQHRLYVSASNAKGERHVMMAGMDVTIAVATRNSSGGAQTATRAAAPMPGTVQAIRVTVGAAVKAGDIVAIMEAMKMQMSITAPYDGVVRAICVQAGTQVSEGTELVQIEASDV